MKHETRQHWNVNMNPESNFKRPSCQSKRSPGFATGIHSATTRSVIAIGQRVREHGVDRCDAHKNPVSIKRLLRDDVSGFRVASVTAFLRRFSFELRKDAFRISVQYYFMVFGRDPKV